MAQASPLRHFPDDVAKKVEASGTGLITTWAPQQAILEHPVRPSVLVCCPTTHTSTGHRVVLDTRRVQQYHRVYPLRYPNVLIFTLIHERA